MLETIFTIFLFPVLGLLTYYIIKLIDSKVVEINNNHNDDIAIKYTAMLGDTVKDCVLATSQTYVDTLKKQGKFDEEAQKIAFQKSYDAVMLILNDEAKEYLSNIYGDLTTYVTQLIEAEVNRNK